MAVIWGKTLSKMKVVYVLSDSPVEPCGGLGERLVQLIPHLEKAGVELYAYCAGAGGKVSNTVCKAINIDAPDFGNPYPLLYANYVMDNPPPFSPDIVIATDNATVMAAKTLAHIYKSKLVTEFHLAYYSLKKIIVEEELKGALKLDQAAKMVTILEKSAVDSSDLIIGCSTNYVKELPWNAKRAVAIQNGIDFEKYQTKTPRYDFKGGKKRNIVFIGRMNTQKGLKHLLDFYSRNNQNVIIPDEHRLKLPEDTALHFVGGPIGGDQYNALMETVRHSKEKFHIPFVSGEEKISLLKSADAILFPSVHEPFGIVGLEAFAAGTPLITTRVDGISDYASDENSIKCEPSAASIRNAIDKLFAMSREERKTLTENAKVVAQKFKWGEIADKMVIELKLLTS